MLKVLAVTAPHWVRNQYHNRQVSLNSQEPFSLENAVRLAAFQARNGIGEWGSSNWKNEEDLIESVFLYEYFDDQKELFLKKIDEIQPNLILIGTMTLGFAGAIQIALLVKQKLGQDACIVLGGKHIIETTYMTNGQIGTNNNCTLSLMKARKIPQVFDLVISGDGEEVIVEIGRILSEKKNFNPDFANYKTQLAQAKGNWVAGWLDKNNDINFIESKNKNLNQNELAYPLNSFSPKSNFPIFSSEVTAHIYSYLSKGCPYNCFFCSEKSSINGKLQNQEIGPINLINQLKLLKEYGVKANYNKLSAFIEDSILLGGSKSALNAFLELLKNEKLNISIGAQLTVDMVLNKDYQKILTELSHLGLNYLFIGLETNIDSIANKMSKNTNKKNDWLKKSEEVITFLCNNNIKCGFSILFGLGEEHKDRMELLDIINGWQLKYAAPEVISLNLATQHPLMRETEIDYISWGTPRNSPYLDLFLELFGEASELYSLNDAKIGTLEELNELKNKYKTLSIMN